jgi:hypothetical protein
MSTFNFSEPAPVLRAAEKDLSYRAQLSHMMLEAAQRCLGARWSVMNRAKLLAASEVLYSTLMTLSGETVHTSLWLLTWLLNRMPNHWRRVCKHCDELERSTFAFTFSLLVIARFGR